MKNTCKIITITGPSASGKSMLAKKLSAVLGRNKCVVLCQDDYYKDWSHLPKHKRKQINFDDANSFDIKLLSKHLVQLKHGKVIKIPKYCFKQSKRLSVLSTQHSAQYIIIEGLMPVLSKELRRLSNYSIYVDIDSATGLARRLKRDVANRGETVESVRKRYFEHVLPMQKKYVEKQKRWADLVIDGRETLTRGEIRKIVRKIEGRG